MFRKSIALTALFLVAGLALAHRPPAPLHRVGDRWTAWNPPADFPEGAEIYTIKRGDTLWDLAGRFYGNPYLWPQLWERNPYILDAHWIYPGDPLVVGIEVTPIEDVRAQAVEPTADDSKPAGFQLDSQLGPPRALGSEDDIYCSGFIGDLEVPFERRIVGSEYQSLTPTLVAVGQERSHLGEIDSVKIELSTGDIVYLDGGAGAGLMPGDLFTVVSPMEEVLHPASRETLGRFYSYDGRVRVLSVQDETAIAEIVSSCKPVHVGSALKPFVAEPVPLARRGAPVGVNDPVSAQVLIDAATIVRSELGVVSLGEDHVVYIDRGERDAVAPGDIFTIYRLSRKNLPPLVIGELGVLAVTDSTAVAKILESRYTVRLGDRLDLKTR
jgi:hypothetical protein